MVCVAGGCAGRDGHRAVLGGVLGRRVGAGGVREGERWGEGGLKWEELKRGYQIKMLGWLALRVKSDPLYFTHPYPHTQAKSLA